MTTGKGMAALHSAIGNAEPGRYVIDAQNAAIDLFAEMLGDLVAGSIAARCPPQAIAEVLHRFGHTMTAEHLRRQHAEAMAKKDAARRAVILTPSPPPPAAPTRGRRRRIGGR